MRHSIAGISTRTYVAAPLLAFGLTHSNTHNLIINCGWGSYQIEGNLALPAELAALYEANPRVAT